jgi:hypothetical protein
MHFSEKVSSQGLPDGLVVFVSADCPTCQMVAPVLRELRDRTAKLTVFTQDDPQFPPGLDAVHDTDLRLSWEAEIRTVPTLLRIEGGTVTGSLEGWLRSEWEELTGVDDLGAGLPDFRPGCGSLSVDPAHAIALARTFGSRRLASRSIELGGLEDEFEAMHERGCHPTLSSALSRRSRSTLCWPAAGPSTFRLLSPRSKPRAPTSSTCTGCLRRPGSRARF